MDTRADLARRCGVWRSIFEKADLTEQDRVLLALPLASATGGDAYDALLELGALTMPAETPTHADVAEFAPTVLVGTPSGAVRLAQRGSDTGPVRLVVVTGQSGGSLEVTRHTIEDRWGAGCLDVYALTELGAIGWGCQRRRDGIHLGHPSLGLLLEVTDPETDKAVAEGEVGELVVTTPDDWGTPLQRFHTGDLVRLRPDACLCGRGSAWAEGGVLGRVTDRVSVRGHILLPSMIEQVVRRHPAVRDFQLRTYPRNGDFELAVELHTTDAIASERDSSRVAAEVSEDLRRSLGLRLQCDVVPPAQFEGRRARRVSRQ
jgi:phenylacetate-CoA ligase